MMNDELKQKEQQLEALLAGDIDAQAFEKAQALKAEITDLRRSLLTAQDEPQGAGVPQTKASVTGFAGEAEPLDVKATKATGEPGYKHDFVKYVESGGRYVTKALMEGVDSSGGFLVPEEFVAELIARRPAPTRLRARVREIPTSRDILTMPSVNYDASDADIYPSPVRVKFVGETPAAGAAAVDEPTFGTKQVRVGTWMMELPITNDLIEDSAIDVITYVIDEFRTAANLLIDQQILLGDGVGGKPVGLLTNPGSAGFVPFVLSGTAGNIDADQVRTLSFNVPEQYAEAGVYVMNRRVTGKTIAEMKDSNGLYLFAFGNQDARLGSALPEQIAGFPIVWSPFMPNPAADTFPILFGDLSGYTLAMRTDISIRILDQVGARENLQYVIARMRFGGAPFKPWGMVLAKANNA